MTQTKRRPAARTLLLACASALTLLGSTAHAADDADSAACFYAARLPGELAEGVSDCQVNALEPLSAVAKVTQVF